LNSTRAGKTTHFFAIQRICHCFDSKLDANLISINYSTELGCFLMSSMMQDCNSTFAVVRLQYLVLWRKIVISRSGE